MKKNKLSLCDAVVVVVLLLLFERDEMSIQNEYKRARHTYRLGDLCVTAQALTKKTHEYARRFSHFSRLER